MTAVDSADISKLTEALKEASAGAPITTQNVLINSANYIKGEMEARVPVRTGRLRQSIQIKIEANRVIIGPNTEYDAFVEFGTKPHEIKAKNKKALVFYSGGRKIIVKSVHHPGSKAQPYVRPAFEAWATSLGGLAAEANIQRLKGSYK